MRDGGARGSLEEQSTASAQRAVRPGALTQLLADLARTPACAGWEQPLLPGEIVGRFRIVRELGRGGFGVVYEAHDSELGRSVAFKTIRAGESEAVRDVRALAEAEAAARLSHPNIVHLYDVGRCERGPFLIMELLRGETLQKRIARGPLPLRDALRVAAEIVRGVAHAHAHGVVHGDLKAGNAFLCEDKQVKVLDFGLAQVFGRGRVGGVAGGTPGYMAPEAAAGVCDERTDVFALGVMLDELVTEHRPPSVARLISRMMADDPGERPASAVALQGEIAAIQRKLEPKRLLWAGWAVSAVAVLAAVGLAARSSPLPPGRLLVVIADTENTTGDADLEPAATMLGTALEQSTRFSIVGRTRLASQLRGADGPAPDHIDEAAARTAARQLNAQALIVPAVRRAGGGYEIEIRGTDLVHGEPLFTLRERTGAKSGVAQALDDVSDRVRREFGEDSSQRPEQRVPLTQVVSANPDALREYSEGKRLDSIGRLSEATVAYERAAAADPEFALAHAALANRVEWFDDSKAERHFEAARRGADRLPPKEKTLLEARAMRRYHIDDALERWDVAIAKWPQDSSAYVEAGFTLLEYLSDPAAARPYLEKAVELAAIGPARMISAQVALGRLDDALATAQRWAAQSPGVEAISAVSEVHRLKGERDAALETARRVVAHGRLPGIELPIVSSESEVQGAQRDESAFWSFVEADAVDEVDRAYAAAGLRSWDTLALRGRLREAIRTFDEDSPSGAGWAKRPRAPVAERALFHNARGCLLWGTGDSDGLWKDVEEQLRLGSSAAICSSHMLASIGDRERSARLWALWAGYADPRMYCSQLYRHVRDWKDGRPEDAARGLGAMHGPEPAYWHGVVLRELGRDREAIEAFRRFRRNPSWNAGAVSVIAYPRSLYFEADLLERLGERAEALEVANRLMRLWQHADADLPYLSEAKALEERLAAARSGPR